MKTSLTHPIEIDSVLAGNGEIGLVYCPGKKEISSTGNSWDRDLEIDLKRIKDWGCSALVSLIEEHEFEQLQVTKLGKITEQLMMEWHHLPIKDMSIPDEAFEQSWIHSGHRLRTLLQNGRKITIHCKGGLGRTGMIASRLMIELGVEAVFAINTIRQERPGSIETFGYKNSQEDYVLCCKPVVKDNG